MVQIVQATGVVRPRSSWTTEDYADEAENPANLRGDAGDPRQAEDPATNPTIRNINAY
jgi:hypothetical protein